MKNLSFKTQIIFKALEKTQFGFIQIHFNDSSPVTFGNGPFISHLHLKSEEVFLKILSEGDIGLAEAVMNNDLVISHPSEFIQWACLNDDLLKKAFHGSFWGTIWHKLEHLLRPNTVKGAQKNIMAHYDLGNTFYQKWLDDSMSYSSAIFSEFQGLQQNSENILMEPFKDSPQFIVLPEAKQSLYQAQQNKYDRIIDSLNIQPTDRILEIGCGWGGFFSRAVERTGCHVTAIMNSPSQHQYNLKLIKDKNLSSHVDLQLKDYRFIEGKYDKIVSIEMIEAVGEKYWPSYFSKIQQSLKSRGEALIQGITIREDRFEDYRRTTDFIKKYVFPGGMLLTNSVVSDQAQKVGLVSDKPFEFGLSYAETLNRWKKTFQNSVDMGQLPNLDLRFQKLWNLYLNYCEGAFLAKRINVAHFQLKSLV